MSSTIRNASRTLAPAQKNRLRVADSSSSSSISSLRSFATRISACESMLNSRISSSKRFERLNRNSSQLCGSTPAITFSSTTKRIRWNRMNQLFGGNAHRMRKIQTRSMSALTASVQQPFLSSLSPSTKSSTHNSNDTNQRKKLTFTTTTKYINPLTAAQTFNTNTYSEHGTVRCVSLFPSKSLFWYKNGHPLAIMLQNSGPSLASSVPQGSMRGARFFSSTTKAAFHQMSDSSHMIQCRSVLPSAKAKTFWRYKSGKSGKNEKKILAENEKSNHSVSNLDSQTALNNNKIQKFMDSTVSTVRTNVGSAEATIKRAVEELSTGDLLSVYGIVFLIVVIAVAPTVIRRIQALDRDDLGDIDPEDPVVDLARMIRKEYLELHERSRGNEESEEDENSESDKEKTGKRTSVMGLERIVADLLQSPQIQEAATNLVTKIIQSSQFKTACQILLKELLKDLLDDPDTLKQVIHLLQNAIVDEKIKEAAIKLATDIFGDDRVLDELVTLVQRLGMERQVQNATQALLVESAHNALNDPEILDHSMEFATDVVGDDVVQQTAGEALYNTMSYAFRPTLSVLLTILGLGLLGISATAFRTVYQNPSESVDRAFLNAVEKTTSRLLKLIFLPLDFLIACKDALVSIIFFPFRVVSRGASQAGKLSQTLLGAVRDWFIWLLALPAHILSSMLSGSKRIVTNTCVNIMDQLNIPVQFLLSFLSSAKEIVKVSCANIMDCFNISAQFISPLLSSSKETIRISFRNVKDQFNRLGSANQNRFVRVFFEMTTLELTCSIHRAKFQWIIFNHRVAENAIYVEKFGKRIIEETCNKLNGISKDVVVVQDNLSKYVSSIWKGEKEYIEIMTKGYNSLNKNLALYAIYVEECFRGIPRIF